MTDRPILFSGPMVCALLEGRKTMTRRILKPQPPAGHDLVGIYAPGLTAVFNPAGRDRPGNPDQDVAVRLRFMIGDLLWVRETWQVRGLAWGRPIADSKMAAKSAFHYRATDAGAWQMYWGKWRTPLHMPRWASRVTLHVTDVRVQRLQDISEADAIAEGIAWSDRSSGYSYDPVDGGPGYHSSDPRQSYFTLWRSINGDDSVDANPWVVAVSFDVHKTNIDSFGREPAPTHSHTPSHNQRSIAS